MSEPGAGGVQLPQFSGKRKDWIDFKLRFRAWCRRKGIDISTTGIKKISSDSINCALADYILQAVKERDRLLLAPHDEDGVAMWQALCAKHELLSISERMDIESQLRGTYLEGPEGVEAYLAKKNRLIAQLRDNGSSWSDEQHGIELIRGLPPEFREVCVAFELLDPSERSAMRVERLLRVTARTIQHTAAVETACVVVRHKSGGSSSKPKRKHGGKGRSTSGTAKRSDARPARRCYICGAEDHVMRTCPQVKCFECGGKGHMSKDCKGRGEHAHLVASVSPVEDTVNNASSRGDEGISAHDWMQTPAGECTGQKNDELLREKALAGKSSSDDNGEAQQLAAAGAWLIDSGTSSHMSPFKERFTNYRQARGSVTVANNAVIPIIGRGSISFGVTSETGKVVSMTLQVLHVPGLAFQLFSTDQMVREGGEVHLTASPFITVSSGEVVWCERWPPRTVLLPVEHACMTQQLWHERMGHMNARSAGEIAKHHNVTLTHKGSSANCLPCMLGKSKRLKIPKASTHVYKEPLEVVAMDAAGPLPVTVDRHRYCLLYVDVMTSVSWPYFTRAKSDFVSTLQPFMTDVGKPKTLRSDRAPDLMAGRFRALTDKLGIRREVTARASPFQNGKCERALATLLTDARTMLIDGEMPKSFWAYAVKAASQSRNLAIITGVTDDDLREQLCQLCRLPDPERFRRMFCQAVVTDPKAKGRGKLEPRGQLMIYLGHESGSKAWKFYDPGTKRRVVSRDALWLEDKPGGLLLRPEGSDGERREAAICPLDIDVPLEAFTDTAPVTDTEDTEGGHAHSPEVPAECNIEEAPEHQLPAETTADDEKSDVDDGDVGIDLGWGEFDDECLDDVSLFEVADATKDDARTEHKEQILPEVPTSYDEAVRGDDANKWKAAIDEELYNHERYGTWVVVPRTEVKGNLLTAGWTFATKLDQDGTSVKHKARLFVRGCKQSVTQYDETSAPVSNLVILRLLLHWVITEHAFAKHVDIKAAYLNAVLDEDIYMEIPQGVDGDRDRMVCKLLKALYGLRQAGYCWNQDIHQFLISLKFTRSDLDPCLYLLKGRSAEAIITLYVDDLIIATTDQELLDCILRDFANRYTIKVTDLSVYLSQRIRWAEDKVMIDQKSYTERLLRECNLHEANRSTNPNIRPANMKQGPGSEVGLTRDQASECRRRVGELLWLQRTVRPDISFPLLRVCSMMQAPNSFTMMGVKKILRFLRGTVDKGLSIHSGGELVGYVDSDWAGDTADRKSVSGLVIGFQRSDGLFSPIVWKSKKQSCVATSSCEAEYVACSVICREVSFIRQLLMEIGWMRSDEGPTKIYCDNRAAVTIANDEVKSARRSRYIDIRYHYARWCVREGRVTFEWIDSASNLADLFTKSLKADVFQRLAEGVCSAEQRPSEGEC